MSTRTLRLIALAAACAPAACSPVTLSQDAAGETIDSGPADAAAGLVTVIVLDDVAAEPVEGVNVAFIEADGTLVSMQASDVSGRTQETVHAGALIAVGRVDDSGSETQYRVEVVAGVQPGDIIEMGLVEPQRSGNNLGTATVSLAGTHPGATTYLAGSCFLNDQTSAVTQAQTFPYDFRDDRCTRGATNVDVLGIALDDSGPIAYTTIDDVMPNDTKVSGSWNTAINRVDFDLSNAPYDAGVQNDAKMFRDDIEYQFDQMLTPLDSILAGDGATFSLRYPAAFADMVQQTVEIDKMDNSAISMWARNLSPVAGSQALDLTDDMLPLVDQATFDFADPAHPTWNYRVNGATPDATAQINVAFLRDVAGDEIFLVLVVAPPDNPSPFVMPELPTSLIQRPGTGENVWPPPDAATTLAYFSGIYEASFVTGGYEQFRQNRPTGVIFGEDQVPRNAPLGATVRISAGGLLNFN
ncbi:MAG TPA: hypothetical protein VL172_13175 [Kofleriaceae bacterium]|nr:hypothetical protein [Kofleriaceae bacterium]